jgi:hypothetical protein
LWLQEPFYGETGQGINDFDAGLSQNTAVIRGGTRSTVKAEYAQAEIDVRFMTKAQGENIVEVMHNLSSLLKARFIVPGLHIYPSSILM